MFLNICLIIVLENSFNQKDKATLQIICFKTNLTYYSKDLIFSKFVVKIKSIFVTFYSLLVIIMDIKGTKNKHTKIHAY